MPLDFPVVLSHMLSWKIGNSFSFVFKGTVTTVLVGFSAADKALARSSLERRGFGLQLSLSLREAEAGTEQRLWRNTTYGLLLRGLLSLLSRTTQNHLPRWPGPLTSIVNQETAPMDIGTG